MIYKRLAQLKQWNWLFFSLFLGFSCGLMVISSRNWAHEGTDLNTLWLFWLPGFFGAILMPISGLLADYHRNTERMMVASGALLCLLSLLNYFVHNLFSLWIIAPLIPLLLMVANSLHKSLICHHHFRDQVNLFGLNLVLFLGTLLGLLLAETLFDASDQFRKLTFFIGILLAVVSLSTYAINAREGALPVKALPSETMTEELQAFFSDNENKANPGLILTLFFLASILCSGLMAAYLGQMEFSETWVSWRLPLLMLAFSISGGWYARHAVRVFGPKRHLALSFLLTLGMSICLFLVEQPLELTLLALACSFWIGCIYVSFQSLWAWILVPSRAALGFALYYSALYLGAAAGFTLFHILNPNFFFNLLILLNLVVLYIVQQIAQRLKQKQSTLDNEPGAPFLLWPAHVEHPGGSGKPTITSNIMQFIARTIAEVFFGRIRIYGVDHLNQDGGVILLANHPNTFLDPTLITSLSPARLLYWAKSSLWRFPLFGALLDHLGGVPVHRRKEGEEPERQDTIKDNSKALDIGAHMLANRGWMVIFPEGHSSPGLSLKPIKTGAARLALQTLESFGQDVVLLPIGLNYMEPSVFRGDVTIRIGEPLRTSNYLEAFRADPRSAVRQLTDDLATSMRKLVAHLEEPGLERLVDQIQTLYGDRISEILGESDPTTARILIADGVNHYQKLDPDAVLLFSQRLDGYFLERERLGTPENHPPLPVTELFKIFLSLFSFASYGIMVNWIPYRLTNQFVELFSPSRVWIGSAKVGFGAFLFGCYYFAVAFMFGALFGPLVGILVVTSFFISAFTALGSLDRFLFRMRQLGTLWQAFWTQNTDEDLANMQLELIQDLEHFREAYAFYSQKEQR